MIYEQLQSLFLFFFVSILCNMEGGTGPVNYQWEDRETCHSCVHNDKKKKKKTGGHSKNTSSWSLKKKKSKNANEPAHRCNYRHRLAVLTKKLCEEDLFEAANEKEGTDLGTSWLIIYPAGFMALINFPPLSLYLPLKVWSQRASGADNAGVSACFAAPFPTHLHINTHTHTHTHEGKSSGALPSWIMPLKIAAKAAKHALVLDGILGESITSPP